MPLYQPTQVRQQSRRGTIAPMVIVSLSVLLAAFALCVNKTWLWGVREDVRVAGDAAALAAAFTLIDDDLLKSPMANRKTLSHRPLRPSCRTDANRTLLQE